MHSVPKELNKYNEKKIICSAKFLFKREIYTNEITNNFKKGIIISKKLIWAKLCTYALAFYLTIWLRNAIASAEIQY